MAESNSRLKGHTPSEFRQRFRILIGVVLLALSILMARMWYLQLLKGDELGHRSESNSVRLRTMKAVRGIIMDTRRNILVDNQPSFDILFMPNRSANVQYVARRLKDIYAEKALPFSPELLLEKKARSIDPIRLEKNVNREKLALVEAHAPELPGVMTQVVPVRQYFGGPIMAHLIGYLGEVSPEELRQDEKGSYAGGDMVGKYGIERQLDPYLRGVNGAEQVEVDVHGKEIRILGRTPPTSGHNVVLTIDSVLQETAWEALAGRAGAVVAMDVRDGSVLALVSSPSFDPNLFRAGISPEDWKKLSRDPLHPMENRAISGQYPPGSTYKLIVAAAALEEGLITPSTSFHCSGSFELGNRRFRCWKKEGHGRVSLHRAIVESCDVYFYNLGKILGVDRLAFYARAFGLGAPIGIDLPREKGGLIPTKKWKLERFKESWQLGESISISIGQGYNTTTPLQLAAAYAAVANGGALVRPRIVKQIESVDGQVIKAFPPETKARLPVSAQNMALLRQALWGVVNEPGGTGSALRRPEADVCGKTGTAQVVGMPEEGRKGRVKIPSARYRDHALFVCFAPCNSPEIVVAVIAENAGHGGSAAAPVARKVIDAYFEIKKNPPPARQPAGTSESAAAGRP